MDVLRVLIFLGKLSIGGGQMVVSQLVKNIDRTNLEVTVLCYEGQTNTKLEKDVSECCQVKYLNESGRITIKKMRRIFKEITSIDPDIIHVHLGGMAYAVPWALLHNKPLLITAHTRPDVAFPSLVLPMIKWGLRKNRVKIAAVSQENFLLMQQFFGIRDQRIICINNGIDIDRYYREQHDLFTFINVSRQDENKNQAAIIHAFNKVNSENTKTKLILVGDGPTHLQLKKLVNDYHLEESVTLTGSVSEPELYYSMSDVYVQSSHREAMPMSVLEALATGLPVISTDVGGIKDVVKENGFLIPDNNLDELINAMMKMTTLSEEQLHTLCEKSKEMVKMYSAPVMAENYLQTYKDLVLTRRQKHNLLRHDEKMNRR